MVRDYSAGLIGLLEPHLTAELWIQGEFTTTESPENMVPTHDELAALTKWLLHYEALDVHYTNANTNTGTDSILIY